MRATRLRLTRSKRIKSARAHAGFGSRKLVDESGGNAVRGIGDQGFGEGDVAHHQSAQERAVAKQKREETLASGGIQSAFKRFGASPRGGGAQALDARSSASLPKGP